MSRPLATSKLMRLAAALFLALLLSVALSATHQSSLNSVTAHEWGTFTSIAGPDGLAMEWLPLSDHTDLPPFVEHLQNADFKGGLRGTIRMETPILYFYSPQETTVSVNVTVSGGFITEWYPHGTVPALDPRPDFALTQEHTPGAITWKSVQIQPNAAADFPRENSPSHYYAARQTSAAPLTINSSSGPQHEKFLFYRGVSATRPPLTAMLTNENTLALQNHFPAPLPNAILFERRGSNIGYSILGPLADQASFTPPALDGSPDALISDLEGLLISQGLYPDEAHAMLETWKSSWFDEGSRVLYIVPRPFVDSILPLTITPAPQQITRVFVGRLELITPATQQAVVSAFAANDQATLAKYNRFLEPILRVMFDNATDQPTRDHLDAYLNSAYAAFYSNSQD
jgi:hypothetical protein